MLISIFTFNAEKEIKAARIVLENNNFRVWDGEKNELVTGGGETGDAAEDVLFAANFNFTREDAAA